MRSGWDAIWCRTVRRGATGCDEERPPPRNDASPNSLRVAGLCHGVRDPAKRRARDSNPQPVARHLISSQAANHSRTLRSDIVSRCSSEVFVVDRTEFGIVGFSTVARLDARQGVQGFSNLYALLRRRLAMSDAKFTTNSPAAKPYSGSPCSHVPVPRSIRPWVKQRTVLASGQSLLRGGVCSAGRPAGIWVAARRGVRWCMVIEPIYRGSRHDGRPCNRFGRTPLIRVVIVSAQRGVGIGREELQSRLRPPSFRSRGRRAACVALPAVLGHHATHDGGNADRPTFSCRQNAIRRSAFRRDAIR